MVKQYVKVAFTPGGREYTYVNEQPAEVRVGDMVEVETPTGGTRELEVVAVENDRPSEIPSYVSLKRCFKI